MTSRRKAWAKTSIKSILSGVLLATILTAAPLEAAEVDFSFSITNNSHVFTIRNVRWACEPIEIRWPVDVVVKGGGYLISGTSDAIGPGQVLNFDCAFAGPNSSTIRANKVVVEKAVMRLSLEYDADFFGVFSLHRRPPPTMFVWFADASNPQWIKGNPMR